ncbi:unnamed protein product, partial [Durusdinium trenchii]
PFHILEHLLDLQRFRHSKEKILKRCGCSVTLTGLQIFSVSFEAPNALKMAREGPTKED